ncbi:MULTISPECIES: YceK/YidQ family lipoprotein [Glaesserella]|uniref:YceK/YidQ family lipoprotein n=1 Tax=Glaesserella australis TaxID=2094024 RepID=A0A328BZD6_9PAST|nr:MULTISPECIES: YceK/YidQ family lipoprotein [Glaesserella]AUI65460.1 YceK/YidQ family lipoprotein [Glaesserella sp. 15-184]RAL19656.1 YceK/YidQ family lipoprotein [Glaesserella australis]
MKKQIGRSLFIAFFTLNLTACGTITSLAESDYSVYAGVSKDFRAIQEGGVFSVLAVIDLPLSFVLDTLMLPVTLSR